MSCPVSSLGWISCPESRPIFDPILGQVLGRGTKHKERIVSTIWRCPLDVSSWWLLSSEEEDLDLALYSASIPCFWFDCRDVADIAVGEENDVSSLKNMMLTKALCYCLWLHCNGIWKCVDWQWEQCLVILYFFSSLTSSVVGSFNSFLKIWKLATVTGHVVAVLGFVWKLVVTGCLACRRSPQ